MKKRHLFLTFVISLFGNIAFCQINTGRIVFEINTVALDSSQIKNAKNVNGTRMIYYFAPNKNRVDMLLGKRIKMTTVNDQEKDSSLLLTSSKMGNFSLSSTIQQASSREKKSDSTFKVELINETKEIAGFVCKKAIIYKANEKQITHWYTEEFNVTVAENNFQNESVPGFSLEIESTYNGLHSKMTALKVDKVLEASEEIVFSIAPPPGFEHVTWEEYQARKAKKSKK
jgi:GLPGLI family protein